MGVAWRCVIQVSHLSGKVATTVTPVSFPQAARRLHAKLNRIVAGELGGIEPFNLFPCETIPFAEHLIAPSSSVQSTLPSKLAMSWQTEAYFVSPIAALKGCNNAVTLRSMFFMGLYSHT